MDAQELFMRLDAMADLALNGTAVMNDKFARGLKMVAGEGLDATKQRTLLPMYQGATCMDCEDCIPDALSSECLNLNRTAELMGFEDMPRINARAKACGRFAPTQDYLDALADEESYRDATRPGINVPFREVA